MKFYKIIVLVFLILLIINVNAAGVPYDWIVNKEEIVELGVECGAPMELSYSCYKGREKQCGVCESCMRRKRAFEALGLKDKSEYEN